MLLKRNNYKTYTFREYREIQNKEDLTIVEKAIDHIKTNKKVYIQLVLFTALLLHHNTNIYANDLGSALDETGNEIISMLTGFAKWGCMAMGIKSMIATLINGGNMKQATTEGVQYWLGFVFLQLYPRLFSMFSF